MEKQSFISGNATRVTRRVNVAAVESSLMSLPILRVEEKPSDEVLCRYFHQTERVWASQIAEAEHLDFGTAYTNADIPNVWEANAVHDARVPKGMSLAEVLESAQAYFASKGTKGRMWILNSTATPDETDPLRGHFQERQFRKLTSNVLHLKRAITLPDPPRKDLTIIPARASFKHMEILSREAAKKWDEPQLAVAEMMHLDDPHWDCLLALKDQQPLATIGVLSVGDIGRIENVFVSESARGQGVGRTMAIRAMEICARSVFKHVFITVFPDNAPALTLYDSFGFAEIGEFTSYISPE